MELFREIGFVADDAVEAGIIVEEDQDGFTGVEIALELLLRGSVN